jgi:hypothetical protein
VDKRPRRRQLRADAVGACHPQAGVDAAPKSDSKPRPAPSNTTPAARVAASRAAHVKRQQAYRRRCRERTQAEADTRRRQAMTALAEGGVRPR